MVHTIYGVSSYFEWCLLFLKIPFCMVCLLSLQLFLIFIDLSIIIGVPIIIGHL